MLRNKTRRPISHTHTFAKQYQGFAIFDEELPFGSRTSNPFTINVA